MARQAIAGPLVYEGCMGRRGQPPLGKPGARLEAAHQGVDIW